jgi:hypothetical protein
MAILFCHVEHLAMIFDSGSIMIILSSLRAQCRFNVGGDTNFAKY